MQGFSLDDTVKAILAASYYEIQLGDYLSGMIRVAKGLTGWSQGRLFASLLEAIQAEVRAHVKLLGRHVRDLQKEHFPSVSSSPFVDNLGAVPAPQDIISGDRFMRCFEDFRKHARRVSSFYDRVGPQISDKWLRHLMRLLSGSWEFLLQQTTRVYATFPQDRVVAVFKKGEYVLRLE